MPLLLFRFETGSPTCRLFFISGEGAVDSVDTEFIVNQMRLNHSTLCLPVYEKCSVASLETLPDGIKGKNYVIRGSKSVQERFFGNAYIFTEELKRKVLSDWVNQQTQNLSPFDITAPIYEQTDGYDDVTKMQYIDIHTSLAFGDILLKADRMSMANSLELRVPFLDKEVFEVARRIPTKYQSRRNNEVCPSRSHERPSSSRDSYASKTWLPLFQRAIG